MLNTTNSYIIKDNFLTENYNLISFVQDYVLASTLSNYYTNENFQWLKIDRPTCIATDWYYELYIWHSTNSQLPENFSEFTRNSDMFLVQDADSVCVIPNASYNGNVYIFTDSLPWVDLWNLRISSENETKEFFWFQDYSSSNTNNVWTWFLLVPVADYCPSITNTCVSPESSELYCATAFPDWQYDLSWYLYTWTLEHSFYNLNLNLSNYFSWQSTTNIITSESFDIDDTSQSSILEWLTSIFWIIFLLITFVFFAKFIKKTISQTFGN